MNEWPDASGGGPKLTEQMVLRRWAPGCLVALGLSAGLVWWFFVAARDAFAPVPERIDMVTVHGLSGLDTVHSISDPDSVAAIVAFVNSRTTGWGGLADIFGTPIPMVKAYLYDSDDPRNRGFRGSFGAGHGFFETQRAGTFASRRASGRELEEFARLIGVPVEWFRDGVPGDLPP